MFNADPDAAALKWDETWCYIAVLIRRQAHTHICIQVLWHTAAVATMSNSSTHQSCCSYNLHRDGRKQEGTQLRIDAKPWERFRQIFHSFLINSKMNYPYAVTNQVASILQSSSAFKCLFIWCKVFFLFLIYAMCELVQAQKSTLVCYWTSFLLLSPENTCLTVIYLLAIPICLHYSTTWQ